MPAYVLLQSNEQVLGRKGSEAEGWEGTKMQETKVLE